MGKRRRQHDGEFKFRVALEAANGTKTINQVASHYEVHPNLVSQWKRQLIEEGAGLFSQRTQRQQREAEAREAQLYEQIGRLKMELDWVKKKAARFS